MKALILAGIGAAPGKTTLAAGLAQAWQAQGKRVGYMRIGMPSDNADAEFFADALHVPTEIVGMPSAMLSPGLSAADIVLVELADDVADDGGHQRLSEAATALDAAVLLVMGYTQHLDFSVARTAGEHLGGRWVGAVINGVPQIVSSNISQAAKAGLGEDVHDLGQISESRGLLGLGVSDLAGFLQASVVGKAPKDALIENFMIGANGADPALTYFAPKAGAAVFCRVDRPDIQHAALDASVRCLILTGEGHPQQNVVNRAEDKGVSVLRVTAETIETVESLTGFVETVRFRQQAKLPIVRGLLASLPIVGQLEQALGLS